MVIEKSTDPAGLADFERNGWEQQIAGYDAGLGRVSRQRPDGHFEVPFPAVIGSGAKP